MSRPAVFERLVIQLLREHPEGMTRRDIAAAVGCSSQQVHKIVNKGKLPPGHRQFLPIVVVGKGDFGSDVVAWRPEDFDYSTDAPSSSARPGPSTSSLKLGERLEVVGLNMVGSVVHVSLERYDGSRLTLKAPTP